MLSALAKSGKDLAAYQRDGEIGFFDDYIKVTSGLGEALPVNLIVLAEGDRPVLSPGVAGI